MAHNDTVPSPCINVCVMDPASGLCTGCFRSLGEIANWGNTAPEIKRTILAQLPQREAAFFKAP